jgi:hypothetical protein
MRVKIQEIGKGLHPSEVVVQIQTVEGSEQPVIDRRSIDNGSIDIEYPVRTSDGHYLIELPRETTRGSWRIWVPKDMIAEIGSGCW